MMKKTGFLLQMLLIVACLIVGVDATAQLVDHTTFEQHLAKARSLTPQRKATDASSPITLAQNPFEIEEFTIAPGSFTKQVNVYFNTAVMAAYRSECCPRVTQFDLEIPAAFSISALGVSSTLQNSGISVVGNSEGNTLHFLGYGTLTADQLAALPTGRIHYATLTLKASNATVGNYAMNMNNACFAMANEPTEFVVSGTYSFSFYVLKLATGITLSQTTASIVVDKTLQLSANISPNDATNKTVTWSSSNTAVATVSSTGLVRAKAVGTATITATTTDGTNLSASCQVTVTPQLATGIALNQTLAEIGVGETVTLVATVSPSNTTNPDVKWTTENAAVATVVRGVVRGVGEGECYITATTQDGTNLSAQCLVAVTSGSSTNISVTNVTLSRNELYLEVGSSNVVTATILPANATNKTLMWASSASSVATVDQNGVITAVCAGQCDITATTTDGSNITATCHVTVTDASIQANYLSGENINDVVAGQEFVIPIAMTNEDEITMLQADLYLPNNVILPNYNDDDEFVTLEPSRMGRGHSVSTTVTAVATRIVASSSRNAAFKGNEGTVMYLHLKMNNNVPSGTYGVDLKNIILTTPDGDMLEVPNVRINVGTVDYHSGDANGDGFVDDVDYAITVRYIQALNPNNFVFGAADMSGDGRVLINDLPLIINAALAYEFGTNNAPRHDFPKAAANNKMYVNDFDLGSNVTKTLNIVLDNATAFAAVQCDIEVPDGLTIVEQTDEWDDLVYALPVAARFNGHESWTDLTGSGNVRLIIASSSNKSLRGTSGAVATFIVQSANGFSGEHELVLKNIVCADANAVRYALPDAVCLVNHSASIAGDVDGNGHVDGTDLNILINIILGKDNADNYGGRANVNGEGGVDGNDLNKLINNILGKN